MSLLKLKSAYTGIVGAARKFRLSIMGVQQGQDVDIPKTTLSELFDEQFKSVGFGFKKALVTDSTSMTFEELRLASDRLARAVLGGCVIGNSPVVIGLCTIADEFRIVSMLAILKIKCAFLSLDTSLPADRIIYMLREAKVSCVLYSGEESAKLLSEVLDMDPSFELFSVTDLLESESIVEISHEVCPWISDMNPLVSVLFTSGSTGHPKGVCIHTSNLLNRLYWQWQCLPFNEKDIACHKTSVLFVDSLTEIFGSLLKGITIVILPKETISRPETFVSAVEAHKISRLVLAPAHLKMLIDYLDRTKYLNKVFSIHSIISSGENLTSNLATGVFSVFPLRTILFNLYGSTETTGDIAYQRFESVEDVSRLSLEGSVSIGKPIFNSSVVILDERGKICNEGEIGQIYVTGFNIAKSYLKEDYNSTTFNTNTVFTKEGHERLYKMGDLGLVMKGQLYFRGRTDAVVKVRGHRVSLREIEILMDDIPGVNSVVLPYKDTNGVIVPVVFYNTEEGTQVTKQHLLDRSTRYLPRYSIPRFFYMEEFPLQPHTAKIDRQAMIKTYHRAVWESDLTHGNYIGSERAMTMLRILAQNLSTPVKDIVLEKSFFENGGNSISAVATVAHLTSEGLETTMEDFLHASRLQDLLETEGIGKNGADVNIKQRYDVVLLNSVPNPERAVGVLARGFTQKNPLDVLVGTTEGQFTKLMKTIWPYVLADNLSNVALDRVNGEIVGVTIMLDLSTCINGLEEYEPQEVLLVNEAVEKPVKEKLRRGGGRWTEALLDAVDVTLPDVDSLAILEMMDRFSIETAKNSGFDGIFAINSHPVTMDLAERQGFVTMNTLQVKSFCYKGRYPFEAAEDSYYIKAMVKHLT